MKNIKIGDIIEVRMKSGKIYDLEVTDNDGYKLSGYIKDLTDKKVKNIYKNHIVNYDNYLDDDTKKINYIIDKYKDDGWSSKYISDGYHTFNELYYHRMILFLTIQLANKDISWKSKKHHDGTMFESSFITGIETPEGQYSYHYDLKFWDLFEDIKELEFAPEYDGHKPYNIERLLSLYK